MLTKLLALAGVTACVTVCVALKRGHHTRRVIIRTHAGREPLGFVRLSFDDVTYADLREAIAEHEIILEAYCFLLEGGVPVAQSQARR